MPLLSCISYQICKPYTAFPPMNAMLDLLRVNGKKGFSTTKLAVVAVVLFSVAILCVATPLILGFLASTVPHLWTHVRSLTAPPYLFVAVNFIILTIWKLSKSRTLYTDGVQKEESNSDPVLIPFRPTDLGSTHAMDLLQKTSPEGCNNIPSISAGSTPSPDCAGEEPSPAPDSELFCRATESGENSVVSSSSNGLSVPQPALAAMDLERQEEAMFDCRDEDDSLDATWNSIVRKSGRSERSQSPLPVVVHRATGRVSTPTPRGGIALSEGNDEINQRFDDFIKKNYGQIRLRKLGESNQSLRTN